MEVVHNPWSQCFGDNGSVMEEDYWTNSHKLVPVSVVWKKFRIPITRGIRNTLLHKLMEEQVLWTLSTGCLQHLPGYCFHGDSSKVGTSCFMKMIELF